MPSYPVMQSGFNAGEWSPRMLGRVDLDRYPYAVKTMLNFLPRPQGPATRRSGGRYVANTKSNNQAVLIPFVRDPTTAYVIAATLGWFRFFRDEGVIGAPYELAHTYTVAELEELDFAQSIDILFLAHQNHPPAELRRTSDTSWSLVDVDFVDGPYLDLNKTETTLDASGASGTITIIASATEGINGGDGFQDPQDVGRHVWLRHPTDSTIVGWAKITVVNSTTSVTAVTEVNVPVAPTTDWRLGAFYVGNYPGNVTFFEQRLAYGGTPGQPESLWASRTGDFVTYSPVTLKEEGTEDIGSVLADTALSFTLAISDEAQIIRWMKATRQLLCGVGSGIAPIQASSLREPVTPTNINAFLSSSQGVKRARPVLVEESVVYLGANGKRLFQSEYVSASDTFRSEELSIRAEHIMASKADRMAYAKDPDSVVWVRKTDGTLAAMTFIKTEEVLGWSRHVFGGAFEGGDAVVESIAAVPTSDEDHTQLWLSVKRTVNGSTVRHIEFMEEMFTTLEDKDIRDAFMVDSGLSYDSPIDIEGASQGNPVVITVPSGHGLLDGDRIEIEDVVGMTEINGYFIVDNPQATTIDLHDEDDVAVNGSGFGAYESGGEIRVRVLTLSGLDHLEGESVQILADGAVRPNGTVASGAITIEEPAAAIVHVGLAYVSDLVLLPPNYQAMRATSQGKLKRTAEVILRVDESAGGLCGEEGNQLDPVIRRTASDPLGHPVPLKSEDIKTNIEMRWGKRAHLHIRQDLPMPFTALAVMLDALQDQS
jgi:hypothetical protein